MSKFKINADMTLADPSVNMNNSPTVVGTNAVILDPSMSKVMMQAELQAAQQREAKTRELIAQQEALARQQQSAYEAQLAAQVTFFHDHSFIFFNIYPRLS